MKSTILFFIALIHIIVVSATVQIDYYRDQYCEKHLISLTVTENFMGSCFKYEYGGAGSFAVTKCSIYGLPGNKTCRCSFYVNDNCTGRFITDSFLVGSNCGNTAYTLKEPKSVICTYSGF
ncbi:hypothetical protein K501DRAFT_269707 [Backusella circina FSU 941]|nr:hypothetical protein K501DRAFT_269707 [Backusella circina FSU 941]